MSDHTESLLVEYDPAKVSYEELMEVFWSGHNPTEKHSFTQYMPALFYHTREQEKLALRLKDELSGKLGREIHTLVTGAANFYPAEDYHQKYGIRHHKIVWRSLLDNLGSEEALFASTAAARVNGALAGHIPPERLAGEIGSYGLSTEATEYLTLKVSRLHRKR